MSFLEIKNLSKCYKQGVYALKDATLTINEGEVFALLGVNGAGKTTMSSIIGLLMRPTSGDILLNGNSVYQNPTAYKTFFGFCPQKPNFVNSLRVREHLEFAGRFFAFNEKTIKERVDNLMEQFGLVKYANMVPSELSGGYKQRLNIARALVHNPRIVIMDEPTVALDPHIRRHIWDLIKGLKGQGVTVILTTHYLDEAEKLADRVCMMTAGVIDFIDTTENILQKNSGKNLEDIFVDLTEQENEKE